MGRTPTAATVMVLLVLALAACGDDGAGAPLEATASTTEPFATTASTSPSTTPPTTPSTTPSTAPPTPSTSPATTMPDRSVPPGRLPETVPSTSVFPPVTGEVSAALLDEIVADAVDRTGVQPSAVVVVRAQEVTWPDGSLGCPTPGVVYTQALVPGYWVELDAEGTPLDYRVGSNDRFTLCENPS